MNYKRYLKYYIGFMLIISMFFVASYVFLSKAFELEDLREIAVIQQEKGGLYTSALRSNYYPYKIKAFEIIKPEIAVLGSSRVLQIRKDVFNESFYNLGLAVRSLDNSIQLMNDLLPINKPRVVLLGLDIWWFNPNSRFANYKVEPDDYGTSLSAIQLLSPYQWLLEGKMTVETFLDVINGNISNYGIKAIFNNDGIDVDGSYRGNDYLFNKKPFLDARFADTFNNIKQGARRFEYSDDYDQKQFDKLEQLLTLLKSNNIQVVMFLAPLPKLTLNKMAETGRYGYIKKVREKLNNDYPNMYFDFLDASEFGSSDCEFLDGFHGGEVTYLRMLATMAESAKLDFINVQKVKNLIAEYSGHAAAYRMVGHQEQDFLGLGCVK